jgi:hypothetical protein
MVFTIRGLAESIWKHGREIIERVRAKKLHFGPFSTIILRPQSELSCKKSMEARCFHGVGVVEEIWFAEGKFTIGGRSGCP